jgi:hypothetical protein
MHPRKRAAQPQAHSTTKFPKNVNACPKCRKGKSRAALLCKSCSMKSKRAPRLKRVFIIEGERCRKISLTHNLYAIVDEADYEWLSKLPWQASKSHRGGHYYVTTHSPQHKGQIRMHRLILGILNTKWEGDHHNSDSLDHRRSNLRICKRLENSRNRKRSSDNTSGYTGVHWNPKRRHWIATVNINKRVKQLGSFRTAIEAALVRDAAARAHYGEFAKLNFP